MFVGKVMAHLIGKVKGPYEKKKRGAELNMHFLVLPLITILIVCSTSFSLDFAISI